MVPGLYTSCGPSRDIRCRGSAALPSMSRARVSGVPTSMSIANPRAALRARYQEEPESAWATHLAWTETSGAGADPFRGTVHMSLADRELNYALDDGVGGPHDQPAPGELLCAAVAACVDATIRLAAARMDVEIERLAVIVTGDVDSRGSLGQADVPVGFQSMRLEIQLQLGARSRPGAAEKLLAAAERYSEVLQTLRSPMPIEIVHGA
jgi:uncharacterized OsmC-like protein